MARQNEVVERAELLMIEAWQLLMRLPDPERGFLKSGSRSCLPAPIRERWLGTIDAELALQLDMVLPDPEAAPRPQLGRREMALVDLAWNRENCLAQAVLPQHQRLFALVISIKAGRKAGKYEWSEIFDAYRMIYRRMVAIAPEDTAKLLGITVQALRKSIQQPGGVPFTRDGLRSRYEASLAKVVRRMVVMEGVR